MTIPGPWTERDFAQLLAAPGTFLVTSPPSSCRECSGESPGPDPEREAEPATSAAQNLLAFALGRVTLDEAELLTLAVDPDARRKGLGRAVLSAFETQASDRGATRAFLEVADTNQPARALYAASGWAMTGARPNYYRTTDGRIDAILMGRSLKPA